jgi:hypothetical protein
LVALEHQIKYSANGSIESITVTGYPAKYVNFRSPGDDYLREVSKIHSTGKKKPLVPAASGGGSFFDKLMGK